MSAPTTSSPRTKTARRARIAAIIATRTIGSQEELGHELAAEGIHVTQATLSRDLDALGAIKTIDDDGRLHYGLGDTSPADTSIKASSTNFMISSV